MELEFREARLPNIVAFRATGTVPQSSWPTASPLQRQV